MLEVRINRRLSALAGAVLAAALVVAPLVTGSASAAKDDSPAELKGTVGTLVEWTPDSNHPEYWEALYAAHNATCYSSEGDTSHGSITDDGKTVTLNAFDQSWPGDHWELLVVKGGSDWNNVIVHPVAGVAYASPENNGGQQSAVSHWIVCKGTTPEVQPTVVIPELDLTLPTCKAAGTLTLSENVTWTPTSNSDGTTTWTATPKPGTIFAVDQTTQWTIQSLAQLLPTDERCAPDYEPTPVSPALEFEPGTCDTAGWIEKSDDVEWASEPGANGTTIWTALLRAGTVFAADAKTVWEVPSLAQLAADSEACDEDLVPGKILAVCQGDVPYLSYDVDLPEGYTTDDQTPLTIRFVNPSGDDYVVADQPLTGKILWPGASAAEPKMWPGWALVDGKYIETDGNFKWTRQGVTVRFEVNPSYETSITYPQATALCANPASTTSVPVTTSAGDPSDPETLAVTGSVFQAGYLAAGAIALLAGLAMTVYTARRRRGDAS
ncbi:hypothetical protein G5T42_03070 [Microbacterium sp. 4R-513]|uniref:hypothetical protein n=1 Tax=Microbacterium sp. 4R-513 TaxID=2567934 RepID=UPI0013E160AF|nr:hypothetical protein [Microbacterium sp. 4R-513]QIG38592.1 hypothetical protein G5T42_03070 [Microbacterium sp. 4R-513]